MFYVFLACLVFASVAKPADDTAHAVQTDSSSRLTLTPDVAGFSKQILALKWGWALEFGLIYEIPGGALEKYVDPGLGGALGIEVYYNRASFRTALCYINPGLHGHPYENDLQMNLSSFEIGYQVHYQRLILTPFAGISYQKLSIDPIARTARDDGSGNYIEDTEYSEPGISFGAAFDLLYSRKAFMRGDRVERLTCSALRIKLGVSRGGYDMSASSETNNPIYFIEAAYLMTAFAGSFNSFSKPLRPVTKPPAPREIEPPVQIRKRRDLRFTAAVLAASAACFGAGYRYNQKAAGQLDIYYAKNQPGRFDDCWNQAGEYQYRRDLFYFTGAWLAGLGLISLTF